MEEMDIEAYEKCVCVDGVVVVGVFECAVCAAAHGL